MGTKASVWEASMVAVCTTSRAAMALQDTILELARDTGLLSLGLEHDDRLLKLFWSTLQLCDPEQVVGLSELELSQMNSLPQSAGS